MGLNSPLSARRRAEESAILSHGPVDGERVMFCAHADLSDGIHLRGTFHWHRFVPKETATDKQTGETFDVECESCRVKFKGPEHALTQDAEWTNQEILTSVNRKGQQ